MYALESELLRILFASPTAICYALSVCIDDVVTMPIDLTNKQPTLCRLELQAALKAFMHSNSVACRSNKTNGRSGQLRNLWIEQMYNVEAAEQSTYIYKQRYIRTVHIYNILYT
ncbi:unnamed protein product [Ceratitis capitata]|uniref:(Mediterranean fruit fly) hypothetical protein n=1 Tax=Ceratitis capitata TaxID=7213 RepID=A0A811VB24_CERCA|nr:unnamed protein product [Ceratitis capitata]